MIDPQSWLTEFRAKDKTNWVSFEIELDDAATEKIKTAASMYGMDLEEFYNYALYNAMDEYRCPSCLNLRTDLSQVCSKCGEIDS